MRNCPQTTKRFCTALVVRVAGRKGTSVLIVPPNNLRKAERVLKSAKLNAEWGSAPTADQVLAKDHERILEDDVWTRDTNPRMNIWFKLLDLYGAERVAAAFLETYTQKMSHQRIFQRFMRPLPVNPRKPMRISAKAFGYALNRVVRWLSPGQVVPMLCKAGDITKTDIGAIRIQGNHSFIELRAPVWMGFSNRWPRRPCRRRIGQTTKRGAKHPTRGSQPKPERPRGRSNGMPRDGNQISTPWGCPQRTTPDRRKSEDRPKHSEKRDFKAKPKRAKDLPEGVVAPLKRRMPNLPQATAHQNLRPNQIQGAQRASDPSKPCVHPRLANTTAKRTSPPRGAVRQAKVPTANRCANARNRNQTS